MPYLIHILHPPAMLDSTSTPFLSLADDEQRYSAVNKSFASKKSTSSFVSAASAFEDTRVERLEKEVSSLSGKLDSEIQHRRRLQEILAQSGISLPSDLGLEDQ